MFVVTNDNDGWFVVGVVVVMAFVLLGALVGVVLMSAPKGELVSGMTVTGASDSTRTTMVGLVVVVVSTGAKEGWLVIMMMIPSVGVAVVVVGRDSSGYNASIVSVQTFNKNSCCFFVIESSACVTPVTKMPPSTSSTSSTLASTLIIMSVL